MLFFIVKMTMYWLKIIGLAPFSVPIKVSAQTFSHNSNIHVFQYSKIGLAYNILFLIPTLIGLVVTAFFVDLYSGNDWRKSSSCSTKIIVDHAEVIFMMLSACIVVISWGWKQEEGASIMNRLFEVDVRLSILNKKLFNKRGLILITVHVMMNISYLIIFWVRRIIYFNRPIMLLDFFIKIPNYIIHWFVVEYFIIVGFLARYFQMVNKYLLNLNEFGNYPSRSRVRDGSLAPVISVLGDHSSQLSSLRLLLSVRTQLYELCGDISQFFSVPILICLIFYVLPFFRELYFALTADHNIDTDITRVANGFYLGFMFFFYAYPIISLASNVTRTGNESKLTGQIIHKLLSVRPIRKEIRSELTEFSLQLLHEEVVFTVCGFFPLDSSIVLKILVATVTYFIGLEKLNSASNCTSSNNTTL